jgi:molecular chaperone HtpG
MKKGQLQIHSQNILPIIKKWLYSEKDIFIRELVSNACDAITKRSIMQNGATDAARIDIKLDAANKTLTISDTGIGMDTDETEKYLAQIAFSGAEEFVKAYEAKDAFIGHFGLGFYSAYMVADVVEVDSLSCKEGAKNVLWRCDGSSDYTVADGSRTSIGTDIILHLSAEGQEYLDPAKLQEVLKRYCQFLPYPIFLNDTCINSKEPLWVKMATECQKEDYLDFYKLLYPFEEEPLFWIHLNVDYPFHLKGILYFPRLKKDFDFSKSSVKLFSNRVFVSDDCKDILPEYLSMLKGVIDSPDIPLNVSRSYLQVDNTVRALSNHIAKKVVDALRILYMNERERFYTAWQDAELIVKLGMLHDEKNFAKAKEFLVWKTTKESYLTVDEYLAQNKDKTNNSIYYANSDISSELIELYHEKGIDVLVSKLPLDSPIFAQLEKNLDGARFKRIDADTDLLVDKSLEKTLLDADGKTEAFKIQEFVTKSLSNVTVEAKSLVSKELPAFLTLKEEERRLRDYLARISPDTPQDLVSKATFVVNTNSPLISKLYSLHAVEPQLAGLMVQQLYHLAQFSQKEFTPSYNKNFVADSIELLETLSSKLTQRNS